MRVGPANYDVTQPRYSTRAGAYIARVYAERNMNARVRVWRPDSPGFVPEDGRLLAEELFEVYAGKARVYTVSGPVTMGIGDEPTYYSSTFVSIPLTTEPPAEFPVEPQPQSPRVDDIVQVERHPDLLMVNRYFRVVDVEAGSQFPVSRRMQVVGIQASKQWGKPDIPTEWIIP